MNVSDTEKAKLYWACRRGMLELDLLLLPFLEHAYEKLSEEEKTSFRALLTMEDPILYHWLMAKETPEDPKVKALVEQIIAHARS